MAGDTLGLLFRVTNWGESHGPSIGVVVEGCPPKINLCEHDIQIQLDRRRPGQSSVTTERNEKDIVKICSGVFQGQTTGTPISLIISNLDNHSTDYSKVTDLFRPSHADFTYTYKYGIRDPYGGGRSSARTTAGTVAAGAIAQKILSLWFQTEIVAYVKSVKNITTDLDPETVTKQQVEKNIVRCPQASTAKKMISLIQSAKEKGDSVGGVIECIARSLPVGLGEPIYDKLEADLAKAILSINACKGFEVGSGFSGTQLWGSQHNDEFIQQQGKIATNTNDSGGIQGGISNGMPIVFRAAFKPTATILKTQKTVDLKKKSRSFKVEGRHDPCVLPRAVPIVEAMTALVITDHALRHRGQVERFSS